MPKLQGSRYEPLYAAAQAWVEAALESDDSLLTSGKQIWSRRWIDEIRRRFVEGADEGSDTFQIKLERQLDGADDGVVQLMAEIMYVHFLAVGKRGMGNTTKESRLEQVLSWSSRPVTLPIHWRRRWMASTGTSPLASSFGRPGSSSASLNVGRCRATGTARTCSVTPGDSKEMLWGVPMDSACMKRNALLHMVHPDTFEPISMDQDKGRVARFFREHVSEPTDDLDRQLSHIWDALTPEYGPDFDIWKVLERSEPRLSGPRKPRQEHKTLSADSLFMDVEYPNRIVPLLVHRSAERIRSMHRARRGHRAA